MIFEIQIPDEVFEQYGRSKEAIETQLQRTVNLDVDPSVRPYWFNSEQIAELRRHFGPHIKDAAAIVALIKKVGTIRVQDAVFQLDADQIENAITQSYFLAETGEPRDRNEEGFTREAHQIVIQRYIQKSLNDAMNIVLGLF